MSKGLLVRLGLVAGLASLVMGSAQAAPSITIDTVVTNGSGGATVDGTVSFPPITAPQSVGGDNISFDPIEVADAGGTNLVDALIEPLAGNAGLRFIWQLASLPPSVPPEGVRYTWSFKVGSSLYQLQAKLTNFVSSTMEDDAVGHVEHALTGFFQLRGNCTPNRYGTPAPVPAIASCPHIAWLNGGFDTTAATVHIDLPYGQSYAANVVSGALIEENLTANMSITAAFQAYISNTSTSDYINGWGPYYAGGHVRLGVAPAGTPDWAVNYTSSATVTGGSYSGSVSGITATDNTIYAQACGGMACTTASHTV